MSTTTTKEHDAAAAADNDGDRPSVEAAPLPQPEDPERAALLDRLARVSADFDNYKKRAKREREQDARYRHEDIARALLPIVDNLERALEAGGTDAQTRGVELVLRQLRRTLHDFGVVEIQALGAPFDPRVHESMAVRNDLDVGPAIVVEELQRGYALHDRLLRPARVVISADEAVH